MGECWTVEWAYPHPKVPLNPPNRGDLKVTPFQFQPSSFKIDENANRAHLRTYWLTALMPWRQSPKWVDADRAQHVWLSSGQITIVVITLFYCSVKTVWIVHIIFLVRRGDVLSAWSGIRPLVLNPNASDTQSIARNHIIEVSNSNLVTIAGSFWSNVWHYNSDFRITVGQMVRRIAHSHFSCCFGHI